MDEIHRTNPKEKQVDDGHKEHCLDPLQGSMPADDCEQRIQSIMKGFVIHHPRFEEITDELLNLINLPRELP